MPNAFNFNASPFDSLTQHEQRLVRASVDIAYFPEGDVVLDVGTAPTHLFVIIKGWSADRGRRGGGHLRAGRQL
jgi:CBS domain-containing protein